MEAVNHAAHSTSGEGQENKAGIDRQTDKRHVQTWATVSALRECCFGRWLRNSISWASRRIWFPPEI